MCWTGRAGRRLWGLPRGCVVEAYDPSLPLALADADQLLQVVLNLLRNAAEAAGGGHDGTDHLAQLLRAVAEGAAGGRGRAVCRCRSRSKMTGRAAAPRSQTRRSSRLCRGVKTAPGWGWRWRPRSCRTMAAGSRSIRRRGRRCFEFHCRWRIRPALTKREKADGWHGIGG